MLQKLPHFCRKGAFAYAKAMVINMYENLSIKQQLLSRRFNRMNDMQKQAIFQVNGPVLILAGAGSGKTTVLVNRIANLLDFGNSYHDASSIPEGIGKELLNKAEHNELSAEELRQALDVKTINPWNVLAITFTNKAAGELKERLARLLGERGAAVNAGTFHSICLRILRREIDRVGYSSSFTIYDTDDTQRLIKDCETDLMVDDKMFPPKSVLTEISRAKDSMTTPEAYIEQNGADFKKKIIGNIYSEYQKRLKANNAVDFDDIIVLTVQLFENYPDVLDHYQNLYRYIMVDEYQDTNQVQYKLVHLLSGKTRNLCVVGDDDQSIYRFRGATIENILNFEKDYENATVIRLEQNYRSTQSILDAANALIKNNLGRKGKNLWTDQGAGDKVLSNRCRDESSEAQLVCAKIQEFAQNGIPFSEQAVLYRMNAQSSNVERALVRAGVPYRIVGGHKFYERKEIKDVMAYLQVIVNPSDSIRLKRIINEPKRGIGDATIQHVERIAASLNIGLVDVMRNAGKYEATAKKASSLGSFVGLIDDLTASAKLLPLPELLDEIMEKTSYRSYLKSQGHEGESRLENIEELKTNLMHYQQENPEGTLSGFIEEVALYTDLDSVNDSEDKVTLMTMHSAKGLEFKNVYIVGAEENIFPSYLSANSEAELEEERRLAYVAVTRAKEHLLISHAAQRTLFGRTSRNMPSRFLREIPEELLSYTDELANSPQYAFPTRAEKPKPVYKPEVSGTVGVSKPVVRADVRYAVGDKVSHKVFGTGVVKAMTPMSNDTLVEVLFDKAGVKKIMANFAKLELLK